MQTATCDLTSAAAAVLLGHAAGFHPVQQHTWGLAFSPMADICALCMLVSRSAVSQEHLWMLLMSALYPGSRFFLLAAALAAERAAALLASITSPVSRACWASTCSRQTPAGADGHLKLRWGLHILVAVAVHDSAGCMLPRRPAGWAT